VCSWTDENIPIELKPGKGGSSYLKPCSWENEADMKFQLERSGGFTGIPLRAVIDSESLSQDERQALELLVDSADFFTLPEKIQSSGQAADQFSYKLTVEKAGKSHTIQVSEAEIPEKLKPLLQRVTALARSTRKG
jgi:hypothetical protein